MRNKPNVLFVNLPTIPFEEVEKSIKGEHRVPQNLGLPMGLLYVSAYLRQNNTVRGEIGILDYILGIENISTHASVEGFIRDLALEMKDFKPDILAFSLIFSTSHAIFNLGLDILKSIWPDAIVVVGGTHATAAAPFLLESEKVDYVIRGEGEIAFSDFVTQYVRGERISIKGLYSKDNIKGDTPLEITDFPENLDLLPYPDWQLIDMNAYLTKRGSRREFGESKPRKIATVVTTRGCPNRCTFCAAHLVHGRRVRYRSVPNVVGEVETLYRDFGVTLFIPEDDMFTLPRKRFLEMLTALKGLGIPGFEMQNQDGLSVNTLDNEVLDAMLDVGISLFNLAVESGSEYVQTHVIKKHVNLKRVKEIIDYVLSKNPKAVVRCYFILGFYGETKEQMMETIRFARDIGADWCLFSIAVPLIGSEMHRQMLEAGYIENSIDYWVKASYGQRCFDTPEISAADLEDMAYRANLDVNFIGNINKRNGNFTKAKAIYEDIVRVYPFHVVAWYCIMECYEGLQDHENALRTKEELMDLIKHDKRSEDMFRKYGDLMPRINV